MARFVVKGSKILYNAYVLVIDTEKTSIIFELTRDELRQLRYGINKALSQKHGEVEEEPSDYLLAYRLNKLLGEV